MSIFIAIFVFASIIGSIIWIVWVKTSSYSREEQFILRHGDLDEVVDVLIDGQNNEGFKGVTYSQYEINSKSNHLLEEGGWKCKNCGKIMAGYVGTCGCGCRKNETKEDFKLRNNKNKAPVDESSTTQKPKNDSLKIQQEEKNIELIRKYKALLDEGAISQEEFEKKKKEIME